MMIRVMVSRNVSKGGGPAIFLDRLTSALEQTGEVRIVGTSGKPHIHLSMIALGRRIPRVKTVVRIDGMYWNKADPVGPKWNQRIKESIRRADGVVYQSLFCQRCCEKNFGKTRRFAIIHNGVDQDKIREMDVEPKKRTSLVA